MQSIISTNFEASRRRGAAITESVKASSPSGNALAAALMAQMSDFGGSGFSQHAEQYRHGQVGRTWAAIKTVAQRIAKQPIVLARFRKRRPGETRSKMHGHRDGTYYVKINGHACRMLGSREAFAPGGFKNHGDELEVIESHPLIDAINDPNEIMVRWSLMFVTAASLKITGKAYWWTYKAEGGRRKIWHIPSHWMQAVAGKGRMYKAWKMTIPTSGRSITIPGEEVVYFSFPDPSEIGGAMSDVQAQARSILTSEAVEQSQHAAFLNGIWPGYAVIIRRLPAQHGKVQMDAAADQRPVLTRNQRDEITNALLGGYRGPYRAGMPLLLDGLVEDIKKITNTPQEMAFLESGRFVDGKVTQGIGVPDASMGETKNLNRATSAVADAHLVVNTINPILELVSQCMTAWLVPMYERRSEGLVAWLEECEEFDPELRLKKYEIGLKHKAVTEDEYRRDVLNLGPKEQTADAAGDSEESDDDEEDDEDDEASNRGAKSIPEFTREQFPIVWDRKYDTLSRRMAADLEKFFRKQLKAAASSLRGMQTDAASTAQSLIDAEAFAAGTLKVLDKHARRLVATGAMLEWQLFRSTPRRKDAGLLSQLPPSVAAKLEAIVAEFLDQPYWTKVADDVIESIGRVLVVGIRDGMSGVEMASWLATELRTLPETKAMLIVRTEATGILNAGANLVRQELVDYGIVTKKEWLSILDSATRPTHFALNGVRVGANDNFIVGGEPAPFPGHPDLSPAQRCHCRCAAVSVFEEEG